MVIPSSDHKSFSTPQALIAESCSGFCNHCKKTHSLPEGSSRSACFQLMQTFEHTRRIDFDLPSDRSNPKCSTDYLYGIARGKMFGILECVDPDGSQIFLKAFSGQYNGLWEVGGWVPPLFDTKIWEMTNSPIEKEIKRVGEIIENFPHSSPKRGFYRKQRKKLSQELMIKLHSLYCLRNFRGQTASLPEVFIGDGNGIPTGCGDCCAPKLLNYAASKNFVPISISEFYWGMENKSSSRYQGHFYSSCSDKCQPILGYMLCGVNSTK